MSQARKIHALIQKERDELTARWRDKDVDRHLLSVKADETCKDLQGKIVKMFPDEFRHLKKGADDV